MRPVGLDLGGVTPASVLCLGAHCDDIEIGCGGTLLRLREANPAVEIRFAIFCSDAQRGAEARQCITALLGADAATRLRLYTHRDGFLPHAGPALKEDFEALKRELQPDLIFTHWGRDLHQDHRVVSELTWNTFRNHLILEYEIPKYDGDLAAPNAFVALSDTQVEKKVAALLSAYASQRSHRWFDAETFRALLRLRGVESQNRWAEAFYCRKLVLNPTARPAADGSSPA
jgi:LmbE family N-acetylglucosaminyl deacetylase